jgi:hypothetical protein
MPEEASSQQPVINTHINLSLLPGLWYAAEDARIAAYAVLRPEHQDIFNTLIAQIDEFIKNPNLFPPLTYSTHYNWSWGTHETIADTMAQQNQCIAIIQAYFAPVKNILAAYQLQKTPEADAGACKAAIEKLDTFLNLTKNLYTFLPAVRSDVFFQQCILSQTPLTQESKSQQSLPVLFPLFSQRLKYLQNDINTTAHAAPNILIDSLLTIVFNKTFAALAAPLGSQQFAEVVTLLGKIEQLYKKKSHSKLEKHVRTVTLNAVTRLKTDIQKALNFMQAHITILLNKTDKSEDVIEASLRTTELKKKPKDAALIGMTPGLMIALIGLVIATPASLWRPWYWGPYNNPTPGQSKFGGKMLLAGLIAAVIGAGAGYGISYGSVKARHNKKPLKTKVHTVAGS